MPICFVDVFVVLLLRRFTGFLTQLIKAILLHSTLRYLDVLFLVTYRRGCLASPFDQNDLAYYFGVEAMCVMEAAMMIDSQGFP